jgi:hypothetical protein
LRRHIASSAFRIGLLCAIRVNRRRIQLVTGIYIKRTAQRRRVCNPLQFDACLFYALELPGFQIVT